MAAPRKYPGELRERAIRLRHAASIEESFTEWITNAREVGGRSATRTTGSRCTSAGPKRTDLDAVRTWARENGHSVSDRGRISNKILEAYDAAHRRPRPTTASVRPPGRDEPGRTDV